MNVPSALFNILLAHARKRQRCGNATRQTRGRPQKLDDRYILDRILFVLHTGCTWSRLPVTNASPKTIWAHFNSWSRRGVFEHAFHDTVRWYRKVRRIRAQRGTRDLDKLQRLVVDTSFVKNVYGRDVLGRNPTDRGRKATKVSLLTDGVGTPVGMTFHRGNRHDGKILQHTLSSAHRKVGIRGKYTTLFADKGYDSAACRRVASQFGMQPRISRRGVATHAADNAKRVCVEQSFGLFDHFRRIRVRYEAQIHAFKSMHFFAACVVVFRRCVCG